MIEYMNEHHGDQFEFKYSTPSIYIDALAAKNISWPTKTDDMMPYSDGPNAFWTGYFSSRPDDKSSVRKFSSDVHA